MGQVQLYNALLRFAICVRLWAYFIDSDCIGSDLKSGGGDAFASCEWLAHASKREELVRGLQKH